MAAIQFFVGGKWVSGGNGNIDLSKNADENASKILAAAKKAGIDPKNVTGFKVDGTSFTPTDSLFIKFKAAIAVSPDPGKAPAAKLQGTLTVTVGGKTFTIGKSDKGGYVSASKGKIDGRDINTAAGLARAEIKRRMKLAKTDADYIAPGTASFKVEIAEDETADHKTVTRPVAPKATPPADKTPKADATGDADEPDGVDEPGDTDKPAKSAIVDVDVTIKEGKKTKTVKVSYKSDGKAGISKADAENFVKAYESTVASDNRDKQADVTIEGQTVKIGKVYTIAEQADEDPVKDAGAKPGEGDAPLDPSSTYIYKPTQANKARLDAEKADMDALIAALLAALFGGNLDVLPSIFNALAQKTGMTVAEVAAKTAEALGMADKEAAEFGEKMAAFTKDSADPKKRAEASAQLQKLQILMQQNTNRRDQLMNLLRTNLSLNDTMKNANDSVLGWKEKEPSHYRWA